MMFKPVISAILTLCFAQTYAILEYELGGYFEGDMILSPQQELAISTISSGIQRNALSAHIYRWPDKTVPYRIKADDFTAEQVDYIRRAMDEIEKVSCVRFVKVHGDTKDYVQIIGSKPGCTSSVGYRSKKQYINYQPNRLEEGCFRLVALMHELLHTLGFFHMHSSPNRDDYLIILWDNIKKGHKHNFKKYKFSESTDFNVGYDYDSIMHYPGTSFSKNGKPTMIPIDKSVQLGRHDRLSRGDITKINRLYKCHG